MEAQEEDPHSTLQFVRRLLLARADSEVLQAGSQRSLDAGRDVFAFERELFGARMLVALNFSSRRTRAKLPAGRGELLLSTHSERALEGVDTGKLVLEPDEGVLVRL